MIATTISILAFVFISVSANLKLHRCYRLESVNYRGSYIRFRLERGRSWRLHKDRGNGRRFIIQSTFKVVNAINGNRRQISLESVHFPGRYIKHSGFKGYLRDCPIGAELCRNDASWKVENGLARGRDGERTVSFRSDNYPGYFLHHGHHKVVISAHRRSTLYNEDSSWIPRRVSC